MDIGYNLYKYTTDFSKEKIEKSLCKYTMKRSLMYTNIVTYHPKLISL